jgi:CRISPR-associated protein Cas2
MLYLISYDVADNTRRHRVFEALKDFGRRVQYSVFECELDEHGFTELWERVEWEIDAKRDSCRWYRLCGTCRQEVKVIGKGEVFEQPGFIVIG